MVDREPRFNKEQLAKQQEATVLVRSRIVADRNFELKISEILDFAPAFGVDLDPTRMQTVDEHGDRVLRFPIKPYQNLDASKVSALVNKAYDDLVVAGHYVRRKELAYNG